MRVVGRAYHHGVDLALHLLQHLAEIDEGLGPSELPASRAKLGLKSAGRHMAMKRGSKP
jgi:hypothetical protein